MRQSKFKHESKKIDGYVLVVDDDADAREILSDIVRALGLDIQTANDGREALKLVEAEHPSLVLLDLMMPKMDGFSMLARMRASIATRYIPVIVVTAYGRNQMEMLRLPGVTDVVQKGQFTIKGLRTLVAETLNLDERIAQQKQLKPSS